MDMEFATPQDYINFLEAQLANAIGRLQKFEGDEAATVDRLEAQYRGHRDKLGMDIAQRRDRIRNMEAHILANAQRYDFLRQHHVQVWKLGIGATTEGLDNAIDDRMLHKANPIADFLTEEPLGVPST